MQIDFIYHFTFLIIVPIISEKTPEKQNVRMISDIQLAMFSNIIGIILFLLVVLYHFIQANY